MKIFKSFLSFFLVLALVISSPAVQTFNFPEKLAPQSVLSDSSDPGPSSDGLSDSDRRSKSKPLTLRGRVRQQAVVVRELLIVGLAFILPLFVLGCMLSPTKENISKLTQEIRKEIEDRDKDNSYRIVDFMGERRDLIEESELPRQDLVGGDGLALKGLAKDIFLEFGIIVEGARERDLLHIQDLLRILPPKHLEGFHGFVLRVNADRFYDHDLAGRYYSFFEEGIISYSTSGLLQTKGSLITHHLSHELGHFFHDERVDSIEGLVFWWYHLICSWFEEDYLEKYGQKDHWEDYATIYADWVADTNWFFLRRRESLFSPHPRSEILLNKILMIARHFLVQKENKFYIRVYRNMTYQDILLDIQDPSELERFHLYELHRFMQKRDDLIKKTDIYETYYHQSRDFVDSILSPYFHGFEAVARRLYQMIEKIKQDPELNHNEKRKKAIYLIYRLLNANFIAPVHILPKLQKLRLENGGTLIHFNPEELEDLDQLEAFWYLEPEAVENWLFKDTSGAMEKIRSLMPYFESIELSPSWPVLFLAIYDKVMTQPNPTPKMLFEVLAKNAEINRKNSFFPEMVEQETALLIRFLAAWDPDFLMEYLSGERLQEMQKELMVDSEDKDVSTIYNFLRGKYVPVEIAKLFKDDASKAIEVLFGSVKTQDRTDLESIIFNRKSVWIESWKEESFKPVLEELRRRFKGMTIKDTIQEMIISAKMRGEKLTEEDLLGIFIFLNSDVENFIQNHPAQFLFLIPLEEDVTSSSDKTRKNITLIKKLRVLFEVSPQAFDFIFDQLLYSEMIIFILSHFLETSHFSLRDINSKDSFVEMKILERIYRLKGKDWFKEQISKAREVIEQTIFFDRMRVYLKGEISQELRDLFESFLPENGDVQEPKDSSPPTLNEEEILDEWKRLREERKEKKGSETSYLLDPTSHMALHGQQSWIPWPIFHSILFEHSL